MKIPAPFSSGVARASDSALLAVILLLAAAHPSAADSIDIPKIVDATTLRGKVMCGYQGWFRCPGDPADMGWIHWSRDSRAISPSTLTFEMWPDMREYAPGERFPAPGFTHQDGSPAYLFSSDNKAAVSRHFEWMRDYGIDGAWLQHFVVDLPGGSSQARYPSRLRVLHHVAEAAAKTGRAWAVCYDVSGARSEQMFDLIAGNWKSLVDAKVTDDPRYLHEAGLPAVQIWGFYANNKTNAMTPDVADRLIAFFKTPGRYRAYLVGGGDWDWRANSNPRWRSIFERFDAYVPWNVGNYTTDAAGMKHASTSTWAEDQRQCAARHEEWIPVVYPGFSWDNLQRKPAGTSILPRRKGAFYWEQFHALAALKPRSVYVAMFDEVDEGTAIFKVTNDPPIQAHFVTYEGMPGDWYLRLTGEGARRLRENLPIDAEIPIHP